MKDINNSDTNENCGLIPTEIMYSTSCPPGNFNKNDTELDDDSDDLSQSAGESCTNCTCY